LPTRRPLPALIALIALLLLTALVWWRVLHRGGTSSGATTCTTQAQHAVLPAPGQVTVQVLNATKRNGIARRARTTLVTDGFNVPGPATDDKPKVHVRGAAEIRFDRKARKGAQLLHYYFPTARMVPTAGKSSVVIVSLGEKYRQVASRSAVQATLQRQQIDLSTATPGAPSSTPTC
jgi:hypothetical protein